MDIREAMAAETGKHQGNKDPMLKEAIISEEREDIWENLWENRCTGNHELNSGICWVTKKQRLDTM
jgi:hypothetical protein